MSADGKIDYQNCKELFLMPSILDNIIDINRYPLPMVEKIVKANRKIGLGVMGFADLLCKLGISYHSEQALQIAEQLITLLLLKRRWLRKISKEVFFPITQEHPCYQNLPLRNATLISIAPTGTISLIAGCSSGIEPYFALIYRRYVLEKSELIEINPLLEEKLKALKLRKFENQSGKKVLKDIDGIPEHLHSFFLLLLKSLQLFKFKSGSISKTS